MSQWTDRISYEEYYEAFRTNKYWIHSFNGQFGIEHVSGLPYQLGITGLDLYFVNGKSDRFHPGDVMVRNRMGPARIERAADIKARAEADAEWKRRKKRPNPQRKMAPSR